MVGLIQKSALALSSGICHDVQSSPYDDRGKWSGCELLRTIIAREQLPFGLPVGQTHVKYKVYVGV